MKITLLTLGTRGDIQPFLALAKTLKEKGYNVRLGAPDNFKDWVESHSIDFYPLGVDIQAFMQSPEAKQILAGNILTIPKIWKNKILPIMQATLDNAWKIAQDADMIIYHPKVYVSIDIAEKTNAKLICVALVPMFETTAFPFPIFKNNLGAVLNKLTYKILNFSRYPYHKLLTQWRKETLNLPPAPSIISIYQFKNQLIPCLAAFSQAIIPKPKDWTDNIHITGYWFLEETSQAMDKALKDFLNTNTEKKVIYIGLGSMVNTQTHKITEILMAAISALNIKAVISTGWGGLEALKDNEQRKNIYFIQSIAHDQLFPYLDAVIHHGGAGTTAIGLKYGLPTLVIPQAVDQPFWGERIYQLGCGPKPIAKNQLNKKRLIPSIKALLDNKDFKQNADKIKQVLAKEKGLENATMIIEDILKEKII